MLYISKSIRKVFEYFYAARFALNVMAHTQPTHTKCASHRMCAQTLVYLSAKTFYFEHLACVHFGLVLVHFFTFICLYTRATFHNLCYSRFVISVLLVYCNENLSTDSIYIQIHGLRRQQRAKVKTVKGGSWWKGPTYGWYSHSSSPVAMSRVKWRHSINNNFWFTPIEDISAWVSVHDVRFNWHDELGPWIWCVLPTKWKNTAFHFVIASFLI